MSSDWSDNIIVSELTDEPALSDDLSVLLQRVEGAAEDVPSVVLNMEAVTYVSSSNLSQLITLHKKLKEMGRGLRLCSVSEQVRSVFQVTGLEKIFRFAPDPMTALAGLQMEEE